jgi:hypothetical protein
MSKNLKTPKSNAPKTEGSSEVTKLKIRLAWQSIVEANGDSCDRCTVQGSHLLAGISGWVNMYAYHDPQTIDIKGSGHHWHGSGTLTLLYDSKIIQTLQIVISHFKAATLRFAKIAFEREVMHRINLVRYTLNTLSGPIAYCESGQMQINSAMQPVGAVVGRFILQSVVEHWEQTGYAPPMSEIVERVNAKYRESGEAEHSFNFIYQGATRLIKSGHLRSIQDKTLLDPNKTRAFNSARVGFFPLFNEKGQEVMLDRKPSKDHDHWVVKITYGSDTEVVEDGEKTEGS